MQGEYVSSGREEVVATVPMSKSTEIRVTRILSDDGAQSVDIRQWYSTARDPEKKPTQRGIRMSFDVAQELGKALREL